MTTVNLIKDMFESEEDDDDMKLDSSVHTAESEDREINVMDVSPLKDDLGLKRKSDTPLDFKMAFSSDHAMMTSIVQDEDSNSGFRFKLKVSLLCCVNVDLKFLIVTIIILFTRPNIFMN